MAGSRYGRIKRIGVCVLAASMILSGVVSQMLTVHAADKNQLQELISQVENMDVDNYTEDTVNLLQRALDSSRQVINDSDAGSTRIDKHVALLKDAVNALIPNAQSDTLSDGRYTITGVLRQATSDNHSMGNDAIEQPMELVAAEGSITLRMHFSSLTVPGLGQGYLSDLSYLYGWDGMLSEMTDAQYQAFEACPVETYHEGIYDSFNDPTSGTDATVKGRLYPGIVTMPVDYRDEEMWVKVYVPIMESVSAGGGTQYARMQLDWSTLSQEKADQTALAAALEQLTKMQASVIAADYTQEMIEVLARAVDVGTGVLDRTDLSQTQVDAVTQVLNTVANLFTSTDKQGLYEVIQAAKKLSEGNYTSASVAALQAAVSNAQAVYDDAYATQTRVNEQFALLAQAMRNLEENQVTTTPTPTPAPTTTPTPTSTPAATTDGTDSVLDKNNLKDGIYSVTGQMLKIDKSTLSMSNDAINHTIRLTVQKGKYKLTMDLMGLNISGSYGYLSKLRYYKTGYTLDGYGAPQGSTRAVTIDSWQLDSSGAKASDLYGTDYPNQVTFPLIKEGLKDGYVPLQVFVPIMEAISPGSGTQPVFLFLDWNTLSTADDSDFTDNENTNSSNTNNSTNPLTGNNSLAGNNSSLNRGTSSSGNSLALKAATDTAPVDETGDLLHENGKIREGVQAAESGAGTEGSTVTETVSLADPSAGQAAIPAIMSVLVALAGFLFKLKSRGVI